MQGDYYIKIKPSQVNYQVIVKSIGFSNIETNFLQVNPGDSIKIDFYLAQDEKPLINCVGQSF